MASRDRGSTARFRSEVSRNDSRVDRWDMGEAPAEGQPPQGEGTSTRSSGTRSGKEPAHIGSSEKASSTTVSSSSHGGGDVRGDSGTGGTSEYYQHDDDDVVPVEEVQELPSGRFDPNRGYQRRRRESRDSPPEVGGGNGQGNTGGDVGGQQAASWTDSWNPSYGGQGPSHYFLYGQVQEQEQSSASGSHSYGDYGETQYDRYPPPPPPISFDDPAAFFGFVDANAHQYQIQYRTNRNKNTDEDEDNHGALNLGRHSFWW